MKKLFIVIAAGLMVCSCGKKMESNTIISEVDTTEVALRDSIDMGDRQSSQQVKWGDETYTLSITRKADRSLALAGDQQGNTYCDNAVSVVIDGTQGTVMNRTFHKSDFKNYVDPNYIQQEKSVLTSIVFKAVEGDRLCLIASVGSPEEMDDIFMLIQIAVDKHGNYSMKRIDEE